MGMILDMLLVAGIGVWVLPWAASGGLSVEAAGLVLLGLVALVVAARFAGTGLRALAFRFGLPLLSLVLFFGMYGQGDPAERAALVQMVGVIVIMLFGFYVMLGGLRRRRR